LLGPEHLLWRSLLQHPSSSINREQHHLLTSSSRSSCPFEGCEGPLEVLSYEDTALQSQGQGKLSSDIILGCIREENGGLLMVSYTSDSHDYSGSVTFIFLVQTLFLCLMHNLHGNYTHSRVSLQIRKTNNELNGSENCCTKLFYCADERV
jgi:hypothetical protein